MCKEEKKLNESWEETSRIMISQFAELFKYIKEYSDKSWKEFWERDGVEDSLKKALFILMFSNEFYPNKLNEVFLFLTNNISKAKCAIIGQDPYPTADDATGRSFEIRGVEEWSKIDGKKSFAKIWKALHYHKQGVLASIAELKKNCKMPKNNPKEWFDDTEKKGLLWLNAFLTVEPDKAKSHRYIWKDFMIEVFTFLLESNIELFPLGGEARKLVQEAFNKMTKKTRISDYVLQEENNIPHPTSSGDEEFVEKMAKCFARIETEHRINLIV